MAINVGSTVPLRIARASKWDHEAFSELVAQYNPLVLAICQKYLGKNAPGLDDLAQEIWTSIAVKLQKFYYDPDVIRFHVWLGNEARYRALDALRKLRGEQALLEAVAQLNHQEADLFEAEPPRPAVLDLLEKGRRIQANVQARVLPTTWQAFWLRQIEGLSFKEVAQELDIDYDRAYQYHRRVLAMLEQQASPGPDTKST